MRQRRRPFDLTLWHRLDLQSAARTAYRELEKRDKKFLVARFEGAPEDLVMVFAKGERADDVRAALEPLFEKFGREGQNAKGGINDD